MTVEYKLLQLEEEAKSFLEASPTHKPWRGGTAAYIEGTVATSEAFCLWPAIWMGSCCWTYLWTSG